MREDEGYFFNTLLRFTPFWDYKPTKTIHFDKAAVYNSDKILNLSIMNKMKCDVIDNSVVNGIRESTLFSFILDKPPGF